MYTSFKYGYEELKKLIEKMIYGKEEKQIFGCRADDR